MGVPGLFAWLRRKYPLIIDESANASEADGRDDDDRVCHNLYIGQSAANCMSLVLLILRYTLRRCAYLQNA